jgi:hypothetical protein
MALGGIEPPHARCKRASLPLAYRAINKLVLAILKALFLKKLLSVFLCALKCDSFALSQEDNLKYINNI